MSEKTSRTRAPRAVDSRLYDSREQERADHPALSFDESSSFNVPRAVLDSDPYHKYAYVTYHSSGTDLIGQYEEAVYKRGFMPVKESAHPALSRHIVDSPFSRTESGGLVKCRGQILMKRTIEADKAEDDFYNERNSRDNYTRKMHTAKGMGGPEMFQNERHFY